MDVEQKYLKYYLDEKDLGIAFENIDWSQSYKLAISFATHSHTIEVIDFLDVICQK